MRHQHDRQELGEQHGRLYVMNLIKVYSNSKKQFFFWFISLSSFTIYFKICLYARLFDTSHCPSDIFWLHFASSPKLWETIWVQKTWMKSIVKELKKKRQKFHYSKLELTLSVCRQSASLMPPGWFHWRL